MRRAILAALLGLLVTAGVVACTRVVVLEPGTDPDAGLPIDDASTAGDDASPTPDVADMDAGDDASSPDAL